MKGVIENIYLIIIVECECHVAAGCHVPRHAPHRNFCKDNFQGLNLCRRKKHSLPCSGMPLILIIYIFCTLHSPLSPDIAMFQFFLIGLRAM